MKIYFATSNEDKVDEFREALQDKDVEFDRLAVDLVESGEEDVADVARRKAQDAYRETGADSVIIVDDTGLYIDALDGFPGSHASFFLEKCGLTGLLKLMADEDDRKAYFKSSIAIYDPEQDETHVLSGTCKGRIAREACGNDGFGYDSVFVPEGHDKTFAEDIDHKFSVSHRTRAIEKLVEWIGSR